MSSIFVDPTASSHGDGSLAHPYASWSSVSFAAGNSYLQKAGTTAHAQLYVDATGTAGSQIAIGAYGGGPAPVIDGGVDVAGASYVTIGNLSVQSSSGAAIMLQQGANHITIVDDTLSNSFMGLWMGNNAGSSNLIQGNTVQNNAYSGIGIDHLSNAPGHATLLVGNTVTGNGAHGIELDGNNFSVLWNTVSDNGTAMAGASGIHVYGGAEGAPDGFGIGNTIMSNITDNNHDAVRTDGNGIELDQYTHGNIVSKNTSSGNDGAGIALYDSYGNMVVDNYLSGNEQDPSSTHAAKGELSLNAHIGLTANNILIGNVAIAFGASPSVFIDDQTALQPGLLSHNLWLKQSRAAVSS